MSSRGGMVVSCTLIALAALLGHSSRHRLVAAPPQQRTISVEVVDSSGQPLEGVEVSRSVWTDQKDFDRNEKFATDTDGIARATLPETMRIMRIWIRKEGFTELFANWGTADIAKVPDSIRVVMPRGTSVGGTIVNEQDEPVQNAVVEVRYRSGGLQLNPSTPLTYSSSLARDDQAIRTDENGKWSIANAPPGDDVDFWLKIAHDDFIQDLYWGELQSSNGITTSQLRDQSARIVMRRGQILHGVVRDASGEPGKPIPNATISWSRRDNWLVGGNKVNSNEDGTYRLPPLRPGKLFLAISADGRTPQLTSTELAEGADTHDFEMQPGHAMNLRVVNTSGQPIPEVRILVEKWRGIDSGVIGGQSDFFDDCGLAETDQDGLTSWTSAPEDSVRLLFTKSGFGTVQSELTASEQVQTITLPEAAVIKGAVVDAATGGSIDEVNVIPVTHYPQRPNDPIVQRNQVRSFRDGRYSHTESGWHDGLELILQFEAVGYRPQRIGPFNPMTGAVEIDVRLERASPLRGQVVGIEGDPISGATVSFTTKDTSLIVSDWTYDREGLSTKTDDDGTFQFPATMHPPVIIATHETGYAEIALELDQQPGRLKLQPWARVEGQLMRNGDPVVGSLIYLNPIRMLGGDNPHVQDNFSTKSDHQGRFVFARVPPIPCSLSPYLSVWRESPLTSSERVPLALQPGETRTVTFGQGIIVRGKVRPKGELASKLDMNYCLNYFLKRVPGIDPPEPIARAGFDWTDGWSFDMTDSQEGRGFLATLPHYFVRFAPDGAFEIHGVDTGDYQFAVSIYEPPEGCLIDPVGLDVVDVRIDDTDVKRGSVDLGTIEVDVSLGPQVGEEFPNFRYEKVSADETGSVAELRGRYVLLDFWATWCAPCVRAIPELRQVAEQFDNDQVVILSVSLDERPDDARKFIANNNMSWPQALLGERDNPIVRRQLGISSVPIYYLIDPEGELIHRSFTLDDAVKFLDTKLRSEPSSP